MSQVFEIKPKKTPRVPQCAVPNCPYTVKRVHRFPSYKANLEIFEIWLNRINNPKLMQLTRDQVVRNYRVCSHHFSKYSIMPYFPYLRKGSLPTINLPNFSGEPNETNSFYKLYYKDKFKLSQETGQIEIDLKVPTREEIEREKVTVYFDQDFTDIKYLQDKFDDPLLSYNTPIPSYQRFPYKKRSRDEAVEEIGDFDVPELATLSLREETNQRDEGVESQKPYFNTIKGLLPDGNTLVDVCRICLRSITDNCSIKLHDKTNLNDQEDLLEIVKQTLPNLDLQIYQQTVLCFRCVTLLRNSHKLFQLSQTTEKTLRDVLKDNENTAIDLVLESNGTTQSDSKDAFSVDTFGGDDHNYHAEASQEIVTKNFDSNELVLPESGLVERKSDESQNERQFMCDRCGSYCNNLKALRKHIFLHTKGKLGGSKTPRSHFCEICGHLSPSYRTAYTHRNTHLEPKFKCSICSKRFKIVRALRKHVETVHLNNYKFYQCHLCGKQLKSSAALRVHLVTHTERKMFQCPDCSKSFHFKGGLKKHMQRHSDLYYECQFCGRKIKYLISLQKHVRIYHEGIGKSTCTECGKTYWNRATLRSHLIKVHGKELETVNEEADENV